MQEVKANESHSDAGLIEHLSGFILHSTALLHETGLQLSRRLRNPRSATIIFSNGSHHEIGAVLTSPSTGFITCATSV